MYPAATKSCPASIRPDAVMTLSLIIRLRPPRRPEQARDLPARQALPVRQALGASGTGAGAVGGAISDAGPSEAGPEGTAG